MWPKSTGALTRRESEQAFRCVTAVQEAQRWVCKPDSRDPRPGMEVAAHLEYNCGPVFDSRVVGPNDGLTMDFRPSRFTIHTDDDGKCVSMGLH